MCLRTTGELCLVKEERDGRLYVTRPIVSKDGIRHEADFFLPFELETVEEHLRHEAREMVLKARIQREMQKTIEEEERKEGKQAKEFVN
jgi:hypothetical protein